MATITKTSNPTWSGAAGWSGGSPADSQDAVVDSVAGAGPFNAASTVSLSSLWIQPSASSLSVTSASFSTVLFTRVTPPSPGNHTLYLAANKGLTLGLQLAFQNTYNGTHSVFIDSGAVLNANCIAVTANTNTIRKYGAGTWLTASTEFSGTSSSNVAAWELYEGILGTGSSGTAQALGTASIGFYGGTLQVRFSRTFNNTITVNAAGGTITASSAEATMNNPASGTGTLTIARTTSDAQVRWNNDISCSLNVTGLLTMGASRNLSGTLSGGGTIAMSSGTISGNAPTFNGAVTGTFTYNATGDKTFGGNAQGSVTVTGGTLTATASNSGTIANISGGAGVTLSSNGTFTGDLGGYTFLGSSPSAGVATLSVVGPTAAFARNLGLRNGSRVRLSSGATLAAPLVVTNSDTTTTEMTVEDATTNTFSGSFIADVASGSDNISVKTGGALIVSGSIDGRQAGRVWNLNNADGYDGTIRITGVGFYNSLGNAPTAAPAFLKRGKIQFVRAGVSYLAGGLTVESGSTVACAASNAAYAAQLSGNLTLAANSTMKFGAP